MNYLIVSKEEKQKILVHNKFEGIIPLNKNFIKLNFQRPIFLQIHRETIQRGLFKGDYTKGTIQRGLYKGTRHHRIR